MKLICATDFSPHAEAALKLAVNLAARLHDSLEIVHVVETPAMAVPELSATGPSLMEGLEQEARGKLTELADRFRSGAFELSCKVLPGITEDTLISHAEQSKPRLLIVGSHGRKGAARLLLGSVAERVIRGSQTPVLVVPASPDGASPLPGPDQPLEIVAGVDSSPGTDAALAWLRDLKGATGCQRTLVHAYWPLREQSRLGLGDGEDRRVNHDELAALLERDLRPRIDQLLGASGAPLRLRPTLGEDEDPLVAEAEAMAADLLVVGTNHRRRRSGSTAIATVRASSRPVICVPAPAAAELTETPRRRRLFKLLGHSPRA